MQILEEAGRWLSAFLRGYAGISAIVSYIQVVIFSLNLNVHGDLVNSFFAYAGPILAMLGYFAYWAVSAVIYEKIPVLNNPKLLAKYKLPTYEAKMTEVSPETPRTS